MNKQLFSILLIVFVGFIGISIAYPLFPPLFLFPDNGMVSASWTMGARSLLLGVTLAAYPFGQFVGSPIIGAISDKFGRKPVLMLSLAGTMVGYFLSAFALQQSLLWLLISSRFVTGLAESCLALAQAIIADNRQVNKHRGFGGIYMAASFGYVIGPLMGGFLSDQHLFSWFSTALPFYAATVLAGLALLLAYWTLPFKAPAAEISPRSFWRSFNIMGHWRDITQFTVLKYLLIAGLVYTLGVDLFYEFAPVYLAGFWLMKPAQIAAYTILLSLAIAAGSIWLPETLSRHYTSRRIVLFSMLFFAALLALMSASPAASWLYVLFTIIGLIIPLASTAINVQLSDHANELIQGKLMGLQWGLRMLGDACICLFGGALVMLSFVAPLCLGAIFGLFAASIYYTRVRISS